MSEPVIEASNLHKSYGRIEAVRDISLRIDVNDTFGYLGHNGAGKSTTIRLMLGLLKPDVGYTKLLGVNPFIESSELRRIRRKVGVVLEKDAFYANMTGWENLAYWAQLYGFAGNECNRLVGEALDLISIGERSHSRVLTYSKGMRRQLSIARSLLCKPEVLFLDEPTSGLDPVARVQVRNTIKCLKSSKKCTVFMSSHDLDEVEKLCDRICIIKNGCMIAAGATNEICGNGIANIINIKYTGDDSVREKISVHLNELKSINRHTIEERNITLELKDKEAIADIVSILTKNGAIIDSIEHGRKSLEDFYNDINKLHQLKNVK